MGKKKTVLTQLANFRTEATKMSNSARIVSKCYSCCGKFSTVGVRGEGGGGFHGQFYENIILEPFPSTSIRY